MYTNNTEYVSEYKHAYYMYMYLNLNSKIQILTFAM